MSKKSFGSASGKAKSEELRRKCVEYLAHYSLSKAHKGCTVVYDKDTVTIKVCEDSDTGIDFTVQAEEAKEIKVCEDSDTGIATTVEESGYTNVGFSDTGLNEWYRALNRAGYRTFMGRHELTAVKVVKDEEIWHYLNPPLHKHGNNSSTSEGSSGTATGTITFLGDNTMCNFNIIVNYGSSAE